VEALTVGRVARRTGLSVRTLHHYDTIGLLKPSRRSDGGYRLYTVRDLMRLQQVVLLRSLGLPLDDIARSLERGGQTLLGTIELHARRLQARIERERALCRRLEETARRLRRRRPPTLDEIVNTIEVVTLTDKYFTPEQQDWIKRRAEEVGPERIKRVEEVEWPTLIAEVRAEMDKGTPPSAPHVKALAARWTALVEEFTKGNLGIARAVATVYKEEPAMRRKTGIDAAMMEYISRAGALK
jgi:MerR family transcriptional regulator, thiopeptide resistance regulator